MDGNGGRAESRNVPLSVITGRRDLGLRTVVDAGDPGITWAVASELADPAAYLRGGELLLTAGINLSEGSAQVRDYVASLVGVGVGAVGFGVAPVHRSVPAPLVEQCRAQGLPLLEVPVSAPFAAVSRAVGEELEERHMRDVRRLGEAHQELALAVGAPAPVERVLAVLALSLGGWAVHVSSDPALPSHRTPSAPVPSGTELRSLIDKLNDPSGPRSAKAVDGGDEVFLHTVGAPPERRGVVLVGRPEPLGVTDRAVLRTATALLDLLARTGSDEPPVPGPVITGLLLDGGLGVRAAAGLAELADTRAGGPRSPASLPVHADHGTDPRCGGGRAPSDGTGTYRALRAVPVLRGRYSAPGDLPLETRLVDRVPGTGEVRTPSVRAVIADRGENAHRQHLDLLLSHGWVAALGPPASPEGLPGSDRRAAALLVRARATGTPLLWTQETDPFEALLDPAAAASLSSELLGPLAEHTGTARSLRRTLRTWLARHGNWDRTAADLGVHRNSVRYRIGRIERDLGVDLSDPERRMRLWFALGRHDPEG
ncbi:PucR family transcriptional regulator [Nocardiopsis kunsanensis]|uniref:PucR family transcriptional regulator n=1 Tax=Nocardiopsis kunsanensis TaxID=141693 RepID=A0A918XGX0_9ACTN|nr:PucR family transcriptional regulator [Nocardiopsis kunsanensis]GHD31531.1 PucR family transcriptional regulator [Nocardiopsis kunsanensis]